MPPRWLVGSRSRRCRPCPPRRTSLDGHVIPAAPFEPSICSTVQALPPPVGLVDLATSPNVSTNAQNDVEGHDTAVRPESPGIPPESGEMYSTELPVHADAPPAGSVEVTVLPT